MQVGRVPVRSRTASAVLWMVLDVGSSQVLSLALYVVFARILTPADYGVFSLAMAITGVANIVLLQGVSEAVIQRGTVDEDHLSTAFWGILAVGVVITMVLLAAARPLADVFAAPALAPVVRWMSLLCILRALVAVHGGLCRRSLRFAVFATRAVLAYVVGGGAGIVLALAGHGVWALVASQLGQAGVILVVMWTAIDWRPRWRFSWPAFVELVRFCRHYMTATAISGCADKTDNLVIGLFLDVTAVGYYSLALKVVQTLSMLTVGPMRQVLMPVLSRLVGDRTAFAEQYVRMVTATNAAWLPLSVAVGVTAPTLLPLTFGGHWGGAIPVLQAMCLAAPTMALWNLSGEALSSFGRPDLYVRLAVIQLVLATALFAAASPFGIVAVGGAWALVSALMVPFSVVALRRRCRLPVGSLFGDAVRLAACGLAMAAAMVGVAQTGPGPVSSMLIQVAVGAGVYVLLVELLLMPGYISRTVRLVLAVLPLRGVPS